MVDIRGAAWLMAGGGVLLALGMTACGNTRVVRVPVEAALAAQEEPVKPVISGVRLAVRRPGVSNDPSRRLDLTNTVAESYPTLSHMVVAVPAALREVGFDVVEVKDFKDAEELGAEMVLDLGMPEVSGFRPAEGDRVTLVGSAYDIRVQYRGVLRTADSRPLGVVTGYGQDTTQFVFMEPLFKQAVVGAFIAVATLGASIFMLYAVFRFGLIGSLATSGEPFGICARGDTKKLDTPFMKGADVCSKAINYLMSTAFVTAVSITTGLAGSVAGDLGETVANVGLALAHTMGVDPTWRNMVKHAHDQAARDMATQLAQRALHPYVPPKPPVAPSIPPPVAPPTTKPAPFVGPPPPPSSPPPKMAPPPVPPPPPPPPPPPAVAPPAPSTDLYDAPAPVLPNDSTHAEDQPLLPPEDSPARP